VHVTGSFVCIWLHMQLSPGMVFTQLLLDNSTPELRKFPFGVLAAQVCWREIQRAWMCACACACECVYAFARVCASGLCVCVFDSGSPSLMSHA